MQLLDERHESSAKRKADPQRRAAATDAASGVQLGGLGVSLGETPRKRGACERSRDEKRDVHQKLPITRPTCPGAGVGEDDLGNEEADQEAENSSDYAAEYHHLGWRVSGRGLGRKLAGPRLTERLRQPREHHKVSVERDPRKPANAELRAIAVTWRTCSHPIRTARSRQHWARWRSLLPPPAIPPSVPSGRRAL